MVPLSQERRQSDRRAHARGGRRATDAPAFSATGASCPCAPESPTKSVNQTAAGGSCVKVVIIFGTSDSALSRPPRVAALRLLSYPHRTVLLDQRADRTAR